MHDLLRGQAKSDDLRRLGSSTRPTSPLEGEAFEIVEKLIPPGGH